MDASDGRECGPPRAVELDDCYRVELSAQGEPELKEKHCGEDNRVLVYWPEDTAGYWIAKAVLLGFGPRMLWPGQNVGVVALVQKLIRASAVSFLVDRATCPIVESLKGALGQYWALHVEQVYGRRYDSLTELVSRSLPLQDRFPVLEEEITLLADLVLERDDPLRPWYQFGVALADCHLHLRPEGNPLMVPLLRSLQAIPEEDRRSCAAMQDLAEIADGADRLTESSLFEKIIRANRPRATREGLDFSEYCPAGEALSWVINAYKDTCWKHPPEWQDILDTQGDFGAETPACRQTSGKRYPYGLVLNEERNREVRREGYAPVYLGKRERLWDLLVCLAPHGDKASRYEVIRAEAWDCHVADGTIKDAAKELRKVIRPLGLDIHNVRNFGYWLGPA